MVSALTLDRFRPARALLLAGAVCCTGMSAAEAGFVQVRDAMGGETANGNPGGYYMSGTGSRPRLAMGGGSFHGGYVGIFDFEINLLDGSDWQSLHALCIQPEVDLPFGSRGADEIGAMYEQVALEDHLRFTAERAHWTRLLWANAFDDSKLNSTNAAAFQLLIWEFVTDDAPDLLSGDFRIDVTDPFTAGVYDIAAAWFANILDGTWTNTAQLVALRNEDGQDLIMQIPAPATALLLLALFGNTARRRRG